MKKPENLILVIFGASGDLTKRKLIPEIFELKKQNMLPDNFAVLGTSRTKYDDNSFREQMKEALDEFSKSENKKETVDEFLQQLYYVVVNTNEQNEYKDFQNKLESLDKELKTDGNFIFYLATPPSLYGTIPKHLAQLGLNKSDKGWRRVIVEKPFGFDFESAVKLNNSLLKDYDEEQIYRIDHYLGKETVQNIMVTRFSNGIYEPLWNRNYIDHVEITSAEDIGVESRGGYYDKSGALRDMVQNHLLHLVGIVAMEPPASFDSNFVRGEILKVFQSLRPIKEDEVDKYVIRGQYLDSKIKGEAVKGYRDETGIDRESRTETYVAMKFFIDNWRWGGVPFYIRTGKRLPTRVTEIVIYFKATPHHLFTRTGTADPCNKLVLRIQPDEGVLWKIGMKVPGAGFEVQDVNMDFHYSDLANVYLPTAYERLLHDCMIGDSTLYARGEEAEAAWKFIDPIQKAWQKNDKIKIYGYPAGTWGPEHADDLIEDNKIWRYPCKNLSEDGNYCEL